MIGFRRVYEEALGLIDWAKAFGAAAATTIPLLSVAAASPQVIRFEDRYMRKRNLLSGYDASEGALYVLFLAVIAAHELSPTLCAVDNADHGLNPRLARSLFSRVCSWYLDAPLPARTAIDDTQPARSRWSSFTRQSGATIHRLPNEHRKDERETNRTG